MDLIELYIDEEKDEVFAVSLVDNPAMEEEFIALSKQSKDEVMLASLNDDKQELIGIVAKPNYPIFRKDSDGKEYNIFFSKDTIKKASERFMEREYTNQITLEHQNQISGVTVVESWIKEGSDKSDKYLDAPEGSWLVKAKVNDSELWKYIKSGAVSGFSLEGRFSEKIANDRIATLSDQKIEAALENVRNIILEYNNK